MPPRPIFQEDLTSDERMTIFAGMPEAEQLYLLSHAASAASRHSGDTFKLVDEKTNELGKVVRDLAVQQAATTVKVDVLTEKIDGVMEGLDKNTESLRSLSWVHWVKKTSLAALATAIIGWVVWFVQVPKD